MVLSVLRAHLRARLSEVSSESLQCGYTRMHRRLSLKGVLQPLLIKRPQRSWYLREPPRAALYTPRGAKIELLTRRSTVC